MKDKTMESSTSKRVLNIIGITVCIFLTLIIIVNGTMIIKSYIYPDKVPDFMGYKPFIVLSGSMEPAIMTGDIVLTKETSPNNIAEDDIITFRVDKSSQTAVTHRVIEIKNEDGNISFMTKGDANIGVDANEVKVEMLEGKYLGRLGGIGNFAIFLQTPIGLLVFVVVPLCLFIIYDMAIRSRRTRKKTAREAELEAELASLKAAQQEEDEIEASQEEKSID